jgi:hypothetical protein
MIQIWRIVTKKDAAHNLEHPDEVAQSLKRNMPVTKGSFAIII